MPRFTRTDSAAIADIGRELGTVKTDGALAWSTVLPLMRDLLRVDKTCAYEVVPGDGTLSLGFAHAVCIPEKTLKTTMGTMIGGSGSRTQWGFFNPLRPQPEQRNRTIITEPHRRLRPRPAQLVQLGVKEDAEQVAAILHQTTAGLAKMGIVDDWQVRALICSEERLLAWVGGFGQDAPTEREVRLLNAIVPALQRRLLVDRMLGQAPFWESALGACMEQIPRAAYLLSREGRVLHANIAGRAAFDAHPAARRAALAEAVKPGAASLEFQVTPIQLSGGPPAFLVLSAAASGFEQRAAMMAVRWSLTARQAEVLALVARGDANKTIAGKLACSLRTVELHVTALLVKAQVESRAELISRFFLA